MLSLKFIVLCSISTATFGLTPSGDLLDAALYAQCPKWSSKLEIRHEKFKPASVTNLHWVHKWKPAIPFFLQFYVKSHQEHRVHGLCLRRAKSPSWGCPGQSQLTTGTVPRQGQMAECLDTTAIGQPELKGPNQALGNCHQLESPAEKATPCTSHLHGLEHHRAEVSSWGSSVTGVTPQEPAHTTLHVPPQRAACSASLQGNSFVNP